MKQLLTQLNSRYVQNLFLTRSFTSFIISVLFSQIAFNMMNVVMIFLIFSLTSSSFSVSMLILTYLLPQIIFSFIGGIIADLRNKKKILIAGNVARSAIMLLLLFDIHSTVGIYLVTLSISIITQFYVPAEAPLIPYLVRKKDLLVANSIFGICLFGSTLIGYVTAGPIIQLIGHSGTFIVIAGMYAAAGVLALFIPARVREGVEVEDIDAPLVRKSLKEEIHNLYLLLRYTHEAGNSFFLLAFSQVIILILANIVPGYAESILHVAVENLSILVFGPAALGMIISALLIASIFKDKDKNLLMNVGVFLSGIILICFPFIKAFVGLAVVQYMNSLSNTPIVTAATIVPILAFIAGFANAFIYVPSQTFIQEVVPEESRSKIFGLLFALIGAFSLIPVVISGGIADVFGVQTVLVAIGILIIGMGIFRLQYQK